MCRPQIFTNRQDKFPRQVGFTLTQAHKDPQGEQRYSSTLFLTSALEVGEGSASRPGRTLPPGKTRYLFYRRLGGPQAGLDRCGKSRLHRDSIPGPSSPQAVAIPTTLPGPPFPRYPLVKTGHIQLLVDLRKLTSLLLISSGKTLRKGTCSIQR